MHLELRNRVLDLSTPVVMGVLNVTPDSFSDGGQFTDQGAAAERADDLLNQGAAIVDIGGESTRPGAAAVTADDELQRVLPVVEQLSKRTDALISVDTSKAEVMRAAIAAGAHMINDVRALRDRDAMDACAQSSVAVCLMHMQGAPRTMQDAPAYGDVVNEVFDFLVERVNACVAAGIDRSRICIDPGFGFGKTLEHNLALLRHLECFFALGVPILVGLSRKSMLQQITGRAVDQRLAGSVALATLAVARGASIIRAHDVAATRDAVAVARAVRAGA